MPDPIYRGTGESGKELTSLPLPIEPNLRKSSGYIPSEALKASVDVALLLGQPLLVTGDSGTGKTTLARAIADELFAGRYLEMQVKSTTSGTDLLYRVDELARFRDSQPRRDPKRLLDYIEFQPLGRAILLACGPAAPLYDRAGHAELLGTEPFLSEVFGSNLPARPLQVRDLLGDPPIPWTGPQRWVVLIDEIDKAPRDTPNDLLEEFERMSFAIPELGVKVRHPDVAHRPVVIVTSNSEKILPDVFLRRCVFHHISFPDNDALRQIIERRLGGNIMLDQLRLNRMLMLFDRLREGQLNKPPSTSELLSLLHLMSGDEAPNWPDRVKQYLSVIVKLPEDQRTAARIIDDWARMTR
jgi:MoxR-like ATPase